MNMIGYNQFQLIELFLLHSDYLNQQLYNNIYYWILLERYENLLLSDSQAKTRNTNKFSLLSLIFSQGNKCFLTLVQSAVYGNYEQKYDLFNNKKITSIMKEKRNRERRRKQQQQGHIYIMCGMRETKRKPVNNIREIFIVMFHSIFVRRKTNT